MTNRKKRLKKGIESLEEQVRIHEDKRQKAREEGKIELEEYYEKEIEAKKKDIEKKIRLFNKQNKNNLGHIK